MEEKKFEDILNEIVVLSKKLGNTELELDESVKAYTEAMKLVSEAEKKLKEAEEKVKELQIVEKGE